MSSGAERTLSTLDRIRAVCGVDPEGALAACDRAASQIKELKKKEAELDGRLAGYRGYFDRSGLTSHHDNERRILLAQIAERRRAEGKVSEKAAEDYAHASSEYTTWFEGKTEARRDMARLQYKLALVRAELEGAWMSWRTSDLRARLAQSVIGFERAASSL